jgi:hypothetical protein
LLLLLLLLLLFKKQCLQFRNYMIFFQRQKLEAQDFKTFVERDVLLLETSLDSWIELLDYHKLNKPLLEKFTTKIETLLSMMKQLSQ